MSLALNIENMECLLLPEKALFMQKQRILVISDLHLGKTSHFRKSGVSLPGNAAVRDLQNLYSLLYQLNPLRLLILGDLFHSDYNQEWELFGELRYKFPEIDFELVSGNHDVLHPDNYERYDIAVSAVMQEGPFLYTHQPQEEELTPGVVNICGHLHPACEMVGKARQSLKLPCFHFYQNRFILPAFGHLTGLMVIPPRSGSRSYPIAGSIVLEV